MPSKILLNDQESHFSEADLPALVVYGHKSGGSRFSIEMMVDLFFRGSKILFFTAFPMARDKFFEETAGYEANILYVDSEQKIAGAEQYQAIVIHSGNEPLYQQVVNTLPDMGERVVFIKNFETLSPDIVEHGVLLEKVILSGDIDNCEEIKSICKKKYNSIIVFSQLETNLPIEVPPLEQYTGFLKGYDRKGVVKLEIFDGE
ncbi:hypothetical protein ACFL2D_01245 [Patescibacteria group bacterium]